MNKEPKVGQLIVIEGASDGIGKTTQIERLAERLKSDGQRITKHHFPTYYSYQGKAVEMYLSGAYGEPNTLSPYFINTLYATDRAITWRTKLSVAYRRGHTILLDRYTTSSLIYQSATFDTLREKRAFIDYVEDFEYNKLDIRCPDHVFFLYMPFELVTKLRYGRSTNEGIKNDVYERNLEFMRKIQENAMFVAEYCHWHMIDCATNSGTRVRSIDSIHKDIYNLLKK